MATAIERYIGMVCVGLSALVVYGCSSSEPDKAPVASAEEPSAAAPAVEKSASAAGHSAEKASMTVAAAGTRSAPATPSVAGAGAGMMMTAGTTAAAGTMAASAGANAAPSAAGTGGASAGAAGAVAPTMKRARSFTFDHSMMMESPGVAPYFNVRRPSDLAAVEGALPIIVWANGGCSRADSPFVSMFEGWVAGGWIVLSLTSGGSSSRTTPEEQGAMIDWAVEQNTMSGSPYQGKLDLERIVAGGNSCGGITSLALAAMDARVKSIFILSGSSSSDGVEPDVVAGINIPVMYVVGSDEDIASPNAMADYAMFKEGVPALIVSRSFGDHFTISSDAIVMRQATEMSLNWMDLTIFGLQEALDALQSPTVCTDCADGLWTPMAKNLESLVR